MEIEITTQRVRSEKRERRKMVRENSEKREVRDERTEGVREKSRNYAVCKRRVSNDQPYPIPHKP
nr:hypothetical protein Iba_scaffold520775CG0010 [Ipomoea batatas]GME01202.1 hypothetical protein Iba_scaffold520776CG0010 [Ipomoea batatas]